MVHPPQAPPQTSHWHLPHPATREQNYNRETHIVCLLEITLNQTLRISTNVPHGDLQRAYHACPTFYFILFDSGIITGIISVYNSVLDGNLRISSP